MAKLYLVEKKEPASFDSKLTEKLSLISSWLKENYNDDPDAISWFFINFMDQNPSFRVWATSRNDKSS